MTPEISNQSLLFLIIFVIVPLALSYYYQLGVSKSVIWSTLRGTVQLFAIGYILTYLFDLPAAYGIPFMLTVMIIIATFHARQRERSSLM